MRHVISGTSEANYMVMEPHGFQSFINISMHSRWAIGKVIEYRHSTASNRSYDAVQQTCRVTSHGKGLTSTFKVGRFTSILGCISKLFHKIAKSIWVKTILSHEIMWIIFVKRLLQNDVTLKKFTKKLKFAEWHLWTWWSLYSTCAPRLWAKGYSG